MQFQPAIDHGIRVIKTLGQKMFSFEHLSKSVETGLYTATVKGILLYHVNVTKRLVSYGDLATATQTLPKGGQLAQALERIAEDDHLNKRPLSTGIVVNDKTRMPGEGFFKQCRSLGHPIPATPEAELIFWKQLLQALGVLPIVSHVEQGEDMLANLDVDRLRKEGEVCVLEGLWPTPAKLPGDEGYTEKRPVPDISLHPEIKGLREAANAKARENAKPRRAFPHIMIEKAQEKVVGTVSGRETGMGVHRTPEEHKFKNHPASCAHANEVPNTCPCPPGCYCKTRTCLEPDLTNLTNLFTEGAIEREKEQQRQADEEEAKTIMAANLKEGDPVNLMDLENKTIMAMNLKEGDLVNLMFAGILKPVQVNTVEVYTSLKSSSTSREVRWTSTTGDVYVCEGVKHLTILVPKELPGASASKLP